MLNHISHFGVPPDGDRIDRRIEWSDYRGWSALRMRQRQLELIVVPSVGGRLMNIVHDGVELAFVNSALAGLTATGDPQQWMTLCGEWDFPLWGGGKTWVAPEARWPSGAPQRDLDSGPYRVMRTWCNAASMGVEMLSAVCRQSGLQIRRRIELDANSNTWRTHHALTNHCLQTVECGIWDVLMLRRPGAVLVAIKDKPTGWRNQIIPFVEKGPLGDVRDTDMVVYNTGSLSVRCNRPVEFKLGITGATGGVDVVLTLPEGTKRYQRSSTIDPAACYAHGAPIEIFNAPRLPYFEIESHAALMHLSPGASCAMAVEERVATASALSV